MPGTGRAIVMNTIQCVGTEILLSDCMYIPAPEHHCTHANDVGLRCAGGKHIV